MDETDWIATECCNTEDRFPSLQLNTEMEVPGMLVLSTFLCECCSLTRECPRAKKYPFPTSGPVSCVGSEFTRMSAHTKYMLGTQVYILVRYSAEKLETRHILAHILLTVDQIFSLMAV